MSRRGLVALLAILISAMLILPITGAVATQTTPPSPRGVASTPEQDPASSPSAGESLGLEDSSQLQDVESSAAASTTLTEVQEEKPSLSVEASQGSSAAVARVEPLDSAQAAAESALVCEPGYVYSNRGGGEVDQINLNAAPGNQRTQLGSVGAGSSYNGLGVGANGSPSYAYQRLSGSPYPTHTRIIRWDGPGSTPQRIADYRHSPAFSGYMVAGAVDLTTGDYYFGGYETQNGQHRFRVWRYAAARNTVEYVGFTDTGISTTTISAANGDIAFNDQGDLLFLVSGNSKAAIGTISVNQLVGGGNMQSSVTEVVSLTSSTSANGIAFDPDGSIYLGTQTSLYKYNPTNWSLLATYEGVLNNSTDLASCNSPSSLTVTKNVDGRKDPADQFQLSVLVDGEVFATATTQGATTGQQVQQIGPVAVLYNDTYTVRETMTQDSASPLSEYDSSYVCTDATGTQLASGQGTEFDLTVSEVGQSISCEFTNSALADTELTLIKEFDTSYGAPENLADWTLTATPDSADTVHFESGETRNIDAGDYTISELFGTEQLSAKEAGYELSDLTCQTDDAAPFRLTDGNLTITERTATECVLTNQDHPGSVAWQKTDTDGDYLGGSEWKLTGPAGFGDDGSIIIKDNGEYDTEDRDGYLKVENLWWGDYELEEIIAPAGYERSEQTVSFTIDGSNIDHTFEVPFENIAIPTLTLFKEFQTSYGAPENPSEWNLSATRAEDEVVFEHGQTREVAPGEYTIAETFGQEGLAAEAAGYVLEQIVCTVDDGQPQELDGPLTIQPDTATECVLVNADLPGAVEWTKTNADGTPLGDSEWKLTGPAAFGTDGVVEVVDNGALDVDDTAGTIRVEGLHWGSYEMQETQAPAGFQLISEPQEFEITGADREFVFEGSFINDPLQPGELPLTGAMSTRWSLMGAAALAMLVLSGLGWSLRRDTTTN